MQTKIVYTLVSDNSDTYLEQALLSVYSLRLHNPQAIVELVVDQFTAMTIVDKREEIKKYITNLIEIEVPSELNKVQRSRYLKTNLRAFIKGDYLFIDCDTVICDNLDEIDNFDGDLGMVPDINGDLPLKDNTVIERCHKAGFTNLKEKPYYNSGVIFSRDTEISHKLYAEWAKLWHLSNEKGVSFDQPALCQANVNLDLPINELNGIWNCQFKYTNGYKFLKKAKILHYYSNNGAGKRAYAQDRIFEYIKEKGRIDKAVDNIVKHPDTIFYSVMTINDDKAFEYFNACPIYLYQNVPMGFHLLKVIANIFIKIHMSFSSVKHAILKRK